jgi:hypothetical protein
VGLIHDDRVVGPQARIGLRLHEQDAVGHELDERAGAGAFLETDLVADRAAQVFSQFLRDTLRHRHGRNASRLRAADHAAEASPRFEAHFGNLRRFPRSGFARYDHDRMPPDRPDDIRPALHDRQGLRIGDAGKGRGLSGLWIQSGPRE